MTTMMGRIPGGRVTASWLLLPILMPRSATPDFVPDTMRDTACSTDERWLLGDTRFPPFALTSAPHANDDHAVARRSEKDTRRLGHTTRNTDDEITLEAPAPSIPDGVPSPLGEDASVPAPPRPPPPAAPEPTSQEPIRAQENRMLGTRRSVRPRTFEAVRKAREAARTAQSEATETRIVVLGIWGAVVTLVGLLGYFALTQ
ncbi:MAG: hypothetical protein BGO98_23705 [Myxococcales bacterium 68-20]|nr:MAG: hypothetical protein BGO98_23705 [Myxococcales bacterium 68-20]